MTLSLSLSFSKGTVSTSGNYTPITVTLKYSKSSTTYNSNGVSWYIKVGGSGGTKIKSGSKVFAKNNTSGTVGSTTYNAAHTVTGAAKSYSFYGYVGPTGFSPSSASVTKSCTTGSCSRMSSLSLSPANGSTISQGGGVKATVTTNSTGVSNSLSGTYIGTMSSGSTYYPAPFSATVRDTSAKTCTITLSCSASGTAIGSTTQNIYITQPVSMVTGCSITSVPTISSELTNSPLLYVNGILKFDSIGTYSTATNVTVNSYTYTFVNETEGTTGVYTSTSPVESIDIRTLPEFKNKPAGHYTLTLTITDSLGKTNTKTIGSFDVINLFYWNDIDNWFVKDISGVHTSPFPLISKTEINDLMNFVQEVFQVTLTDSVFQNDIIDLKDFNLIVDAIKKKNATATLNKIPSNKTIYQAWADGDFITFQNQINDLIV